MPWIDFDDDAVRFPALKFLTIDGNLCSIEFSKERTPLIEHLVIDQSDNVGAVRVIDFDLPELKRLSIDHVTVDDDSSCSFAHSLNRSPKLVAFYGSELCGLQVGRRCDAHNLVLPSCENLSFCQGGDLGHLLLYAPRLKRLDLQASLFESVRIFDDLDLVHFCLAGGEGMEAVANHKRLVSTAKAIAADDPPSRYDVNLVADKQYGPSDIDDEQQKLGGNILTHPRCYYDSYIFGDDEGKADDPLTPDIEKRLRELCEDYDTDIEALSAADRLVLQSIAEDYLDADGTAAGEAAEEDEEGSDSDDDDGEMSV